VVENAFPISKSSAEAGVGKLNKLLMKFRFRSKPLVILHQSSLRRMQRRAGRGLAYISLPPQHNAGMGSDSERTSRFNQRSLGVTNRIWMLLILLVFLLTFTHFIWPSIGTATVIKNYSNADLKAKNYFNATEAGPNPFEFCPIYGPDDELGTKYGALTLSKSRLHLGSGARIQRVLNRALAGQPVTISILGGSSTCLPFFFPVPERS